jgi:hypothetical protein
MRWRVGTGGPSGLPSRALASRPARSRRAALLVRLLLAGVALSVVVPTPAQAQTTYSFTNAGATGRFGPTQTQLNNAYAGTTLGGQVTSNSGVQQWTVPASGRYRFTVVGAHGAASTGASNQRGGRGAFVTAERDLVAGQRLHIVVGQAGLANGSHGGGGGASFVNVGDRTSTTNLIVAGGGGGTRTGATSNGGDASTATHGLTALTNSGSANPNQNNTVALGFRSSGDAPLRGTTSNAHTDVGFGGIGAASCFGDGGAGWFGDGHRDSRLGVRAARLSTVPTGGGAPGTTTHGGFGGGGAGEGCNGGGGGGGYTGGNGGWIAGGGGSYVSGFTGTSIGIDTARSFTRGGAAQHGYVTITFAGKQDQTISFVNPGTRTFGSNFSLSATATSGLTVAYTSTTTNICTVSGSTVTPVAAGTCTVRASQAGNNSWNAAPNVTQSFTIARASQTITFSRPADRSFSATPFVVTATASSGLAVTLASTSPTVCVVSGSDVTMLRSGTCTIVASQSGNANYLAATAVTRSFTVTAATQAVAVGGGAQVQEFGFTGAPQTYVVPAGVTSITVEAWGAQGGDITSHQPLLGALGGYVKGTIAVVPGEVLTVHVGGRGASRLGDHPYPSCTQVDGGWNGGGFTRTAGNGTPGGGASDVRSGATLASRLIVAGGGGGGGWTFAAGGAGGGDSASTVAGVGLVASGADGTRQNGAGVGAGGGGSVGGAPGATSGSCTDATARTGALGVGGGATGSNAGGGGGGGGYFGGGGGGFGDGGGGGSSFLTRAADRVVTDETAPVFQRGARSGDGRVVITATAPSLGATELYRTEPIPVPASSTSGLPTTLTSLTPAICSVDVDAGTTTLLSVGACTLRVTQDGDERFLAATPLDISFTVVRNQQTIALDTAQTVTVTPDVAGALQPAVARTLSSGLIYGDGTFTVVATSSASTVDAPLTVTLASSTPSVCTADGLSVTLRAAGDCTLVASQAGDAFFDPAPPVTITVPVAPRVLTAPATSIASRTYNASTAAGVLTVGPLVGLVGTETLNVTGSAGAYPSPDVGTRASTVSFTLRDGLNGGRAANYTIAPMTVEGQVLVRPLTLVPAPLAKTTDDATPPFTVSAVGLAPGESIQSVDTWQFCPGDVFTSCTVGDLLGLAAIDEPAVRTTVGAFRFQPGSFTLAAGRPTTNYSVTRATATYTITLGAPARTLLDPWTPATVPSGQLFDVQPSVTVRDAGGNLITSGPASTATITATVTGAGGALIGTTTATAFEGRATFTGLGLTGTAASTYTVAFTASFLDTDGVTTVTLAADGAVATKQVSATFGAPAQLVVTTGATGYDARSGVPFAVAPRVEIQDAQGNVVTSSTLRVGVTAPVGVRVSSTSGSAPQADAGVVEFSGLALSGTTGSVELVLRAPGLPEVTQTVMVASGPAAQVELTRAAAGGRVGDPFVTQPQVTVRDAAGNLVTDDYAVRVSLVRVAGTGTLLDTVATPADPTDAEQLSFDLPVVAGRADFAGLGIVGIAGTTYRIEYQLLDAADAVIAEVAPAIQFLTATTGDPYRIELEREPSATTRVAAPLNVTPRVLVRDRGGNPVAGSAVTVTATGSDAAVPLTGATRTASTSVIELTDLRLSGSAGASTTLEFGATFGATTLLGTPTAQVAISSGVPDRLVFGAGTQQTSTTDGDAGLPLATAPSLRVVDAAGNTVLDVAGEVTATVTLVGDPDAAAAGALVGRTARPLGSGAVTFDGLGVRGTAGRTYRITFATTVDGIALSATLDVAVVPGAPAQLTIDTSTASVASGAAWSPTVTVRDGDGNVVTSQVTVTAELQQVFRSMPGLAGWSTLATGAFTGPAGVRASDTLSVGIASSGGSVAFAGLGLEGVAGQTYRVRYSAPGLTSVDQTVTVTAAGAPHSVAIVREAAGARSGLPFALAPRLEVRDTSGNVVPLGVGQQVTVTVSSASGGTPAGTLTGATLTLTGPAEEGGAAVPAVVTFPAAGSAGALSLAGTVGTYDLAFTVTFDDGSDPAAPVTVGSVEQQGVALAAGEAAGVVVITGPDGAASGRSFATQPVVEVRDASGNPVADFTGTVRASTGVGFGAVGGTEVPVLGGRARFVDLGLRGAAGSGRSVTFSLRSGGTAVAGATVDATFALTAGDPVRLRLVAGTSPAGRLAPAGATIASVSGQVAPQVEVVDSAGNRVDIDDVDVTVNASSGSAVGTTASTSGGVATFTDLRVDGPAGATARLVLSATVGSGAQAVALTPVSAEVTFAAGPAHRIVLERPATETRAGVTWTAGTAPNVIAVDVFDNPTVLGEGDVALVVSGPVGNTFALHVADDGTPSASITRTLATSGGAARAMFSDVALRGTAGQTATLTFTHAPTSSTVTTTLTLRHGPAAALAVTTPAAGLRSGVAFGTMPVLEVRDSSGNRVLDHQGTVTVSTSVTGAGAGLSGTTTVDVVEGVASFAGRGLRLAGPAVAAGTASTLTFSTSSGALTATQGVTLTPGDPVRLAFVEGSEPPAAPKAGVEFAAPVKVALLDAFGNVVPAAGTSVSIGSSAGASVGGTTTAVTGADGVASLAGLRLDGPAESYRLTVSAPGLAPASRTVALGTPTAAEASGLRLRIDPAAASVRAPAEATFGSLGVTDQVRVVDEHGNEVQGSFTVRVRNGAGIAVSDTGADRGATFDMTTDAAGRLNVGSLRILGAADSSPGANRTISVPSRLNLQSNTANQEVAGFGMGTGFTGTLLVSVGFASAPAGTTFSLPTNGGLTRAFGFNSWESVRAISFTGSRADADAALQSLRVSTVADTRSAASSGRVDRAAEREAGIFYGRGEVRTLLYQYVVIAGLADHMRRMRPERCCHVPIGQRCDRLPRHDHQRAGERLSSRTTSRTRPTSGSARATMWTPSRALGDLLPPAREGGIGSRAPRLERSSGEGQRLGSAGAIRHATL